MVCLIKLFINIKYNQGLKLLDFKYHLNLIIYNKLFKMQMNFKIINNKLHNEMYVKLDFIYIILLDYIYIILLSK